MTLISLHGPAVRRPIQRNTAPQSTRERTRLAAAARGATIFDDHVFGATTPVLRERSERDRRAAREALRERTLACDDVAVDLSRGSEPYAEKEDCRSEAME